jgi:hypothetical protein
VRINESIHAAAPERIGGRGIEFDQYTFRGLCSSPKHKESRLPLLNATAILAHELGTPFQQDYLCIVSIDIAGQQTAGESRYVGGKCGLQDAVEEGAFGQGKGPVCQLFRTRCLEDRRLEVPTQSSLRSGRGLRSSPIDLKPWI